jgi:hypothetical protein
VFHVPAGSAAYEYGYRFGTCEEGERETYAAGGARFVEP